MSRPLFTPGKNPVPILQEAGWAPGLVWTGAENLAHTGIRSRTAQSVASRYTDYATRPTLEIATNKKFTTNGEGNIVKGYSEHLCNGKWSKL